MESDPIDIAIESIPVKSVLTFSNSMITYLDLLYCTLPPDVQLHLLRVLIF